MANSDAPREWWLDWNLSYVTDIYKPIFGGHSVQEATYRTLEKWLPAYIYEFNRQLRGDILDVPHRFTRRPEERTLPRNVSCSLLVSTNRTADPPERLGDGSYLTHYAVEIACHVFGTKDFHETQALTYAYAAAVRSALVQHPSLDDFASDSMWVGEEFTYGEHSSTRYTGLAREHFIVSLYGTVDSFGGPPLPAYAANPSDALPSIGEPSAIHTVTTVDPVVDNITESPTP